MRYFLALMGGLWGMMLMLTACQSTPTPVQTPSVTEEVLPEGLSPDEVSALR